MTDHGPLAPRLPAAFWEVPYVAARFPGSPAVARRPGLTAGANCQLFAYEVLAHLGAGRLPDLRSDELWADTEATHRVTDVRPLDLLLFNCTDNAYGAHVGVWVGDDAVLHLCAEAGRPVVWGLAEFAARARYRCLVGVKRAGRDEGPASPRGAR
ncbi:hydrolase [Streptomyces formicae]